MNLRQTKKHLKKQLKKLESDNILMHKIIENSPKMQELYNLYNTPLHITQSTMYFQEYKAARLLSPKDLEYITLFERELDKQLLENVKENITYEIDTKGSMPTITASIFIGKKDT